MGARRLDIARRALTPAPESGRRPVSGRHAVLRTVRGDILVTLDAPLDDLTLAYSGSAQVAHEGEVTLF